MFRNLKLMVIGALMMVLVGCSKEVDDKQFATTAFVLDTLISINLYDQGSEALLDAMVAELERIDATMSAYDSGSDVYRVNGAAGQHPVQVSPETYEVIKRGIDYGVLSDGAFDLTFGPVVKLWGIGTDYAKVPEAAALEDALNLVDYQKVVLSEDNHVYIAAGMAIDLGGIAKGYAADRLAQMAKEAGVAYAIINLGGNVRTLGQKPDGTAYRVGLQNPLGTRNTYFGIVHIGDASVVSSGDYERHFEADGEVYHHIFSPDTGYPVKNSLAAVNIIGDASMDADALSTAIYVLGLEAGLTLIESLEDVDCVFVTHDKEVVLSSGIQEAFELTDHSFKVVAAP